MLPANQHPAAYLRVFIITSLLCIVGQCVTLFYGFPSSIFSLSNQFKSKLEHGLVSCLMTESSHLSPAIGWHLDLNWLLNLTLFFLHISGSIAHKWLSV